MKTWIDGHDRVEGAAPLAPVAKYQTIEDLPLPLRQQLVELRRKGMPIPEIADFFSLPVEWVHLFVETPPGSPEH
jgi:hypothetical protein